MSRTVLVIWNSKAGSAKFATDLRRDLENRPGTELIESDSYAASVKLASRSDGDETTVVAAGGDGTINAVINGLMKRPDSPRLVVLPLGTGNNLCRTLGIPLDPAQAVRLIETSATRDIDVVEVRTAEKRMFFVNVASGGNSDRVIENLTDKIKRAWGPWCYLRSAVPVIADLKGYEATIQLDDSPPELHTMWNVLIANSHLAGSGLPVAPRARIDDGLLDVIIILDGTPLDTTRLTAEFFLGDYLEDERVLYRTARRIHIESKPEFGFLADGEFFKGQPYTFVVHPHALRVVVAPDQAA